MGKRTFRAYRIRTSDEDLPLFEQLGLRPFALRLWKEGAVGEVRFADGAWIKILVVCCSAYFWTFEVYSAESERTYHIKTGSGTLTEYWPFVERLAQGMLVIATVPMKSGESGQTEWAETLQTELRA